MGSHIWHAHKVTAREYKATYELPYKMSLISTEIYAKKSEAFEQDREKYLKNLEGTEHQFRKGHTNNGKRTSEYDKKRQLKQIEAVNDTRKGKFEACIVYKMSFRHLESHLYNAHGFLSVKK